MGGFGSGRHGGGRCTNDMHALDIRKVQRAGLLKPGNSFSWQWTCNGEKIASITLRTDYDVPVSKVTLDYRTRPHGGEWEDMNYLVYVSRTGCNYGGQRVWWLCPARGCGRRVAVLYGGSVYACRHCHHLSYRSQREQPHDRAGRRADKIRARLQWEPGILNGDGVKPTGMHWATFERLRANHNNQVNQALADMAAKLGLVAGKLGEIDAEMDRWRRR